MWGRFNVVDARLEKDRYEKYRYEETGMTIIGMKRRRTGVEEEEVGLWGGSNVVESAPRALGCNEVVTPGRALHYGDNDKDDDADEDDDDEDGDEDDDEDDDEGEGCTESVRM